MILLHKQFKIINNIINQFNKTNSYKFYIPIQRLIESDIYKLTDLYTKSILFHQKPNLFNSIDLKQQSVKIKPIANIPSTDSIIFDYKQNNKYSIYDDLIDHKPVYIDLKTNEYEQFAFIENKSDIIFLQKI